MPGDVIAVASIISGAAVAIAVPWVNAQLERSKLRFVAQGQRLAELRDRVDEAMSAVTAAQSAAARAEAAVETAQRTDASAGDEAVAQASLEFLREQVNAVLSAEQRLAVRLGSAAPVVTQYLRVSELAREIQGELEAVLISGPASDDPVVYSEAAASIARLAADLNSQKAHFIEEAARLGGPETWG